MMSILLCSQFAIMFLKNGITLNSWHSPDVNCYAVLLTTERLLFSFSSNKQSNDDEPGSKLDIIGVIEILGNKETGEIEKSSLNVGLSWMFISNTSLSFIKSDSYNITDGHEH